MPAGIDLRPKKTCARPARPARPARSEISRLRRGERGDAEVFGMLSFAPVMMAIVALIAAAAIFRAAQTTAFAAARECARVASAHLDPGGGAAAGIAAAQTTLLGSHIPMAQVVIELSGHAGPGSEVGCVVRARLGFAALPLTGWFGLTDAVVRADASAVVEKHKSR